jgi:DNA-binding NarL/FixJ family response regulator
MLVSLPNDESMRQDDRARCVAVLIADPHQGTRSALRIALTDAEAVQVVGEAPDVPSAIGAVSGAHVDIVLADSGIAGLRSESARAGLVELSRRVPVIVMGMSDPCAYTAPIRAAGAAGYWPKDGDLAQLTELLSAAATATPPYRSGRSRLLLPRND